MTDELAAAIAAKMDRQDRSAAAKAGTDEFRAALQARIRDERAAEQSIKNPPRKES